MKIEKVNENQIRCTLTKQDLADRQINLRELAYGSEKAKGLFHDIQRLNPLSAHISVPYISPHFIQYYFFCFIISQITTGAPNTAVTVPIASSDGENIVLAIRSQNIQKTEPHRKIAGIVTSGFVVLSDNLVICGTAIPTNDIGPASAVTQAESILDSITIHTLKNLILIPILCAYPSPNR